MDRSRSQAAGPESGDGRRAVVPTSISTRHASKAESSKVSWKAIQPSVDWSWMNERQKKPADAFTAADYMARTGVASMTAYRKLNRLVAEGKLERIECLILNSNGRWVPGKAYRRKHAAPAA
jgi:hypothetical protein